jgi:hypothetical protein
VQVSISSYSTVCLDKKERTMEEYIRKMGRCMDGKKAIIV